MQFNQALLAVALSCSMAHAAPQLRGVAPLPGDTTVAPALGTKDDPAIAAGADTYLAVYEDERTTAVPTVGGDPWEVVQTDIYATRIAADGSVIDTTPIVVDSSAYSQENPAACWNGTSWLVAFDSRSPTELGSSTTRDIRAVRVSASGQVLDRIPIAIAASDDDVFAPTVGSDGVNWVVVWTDTKKLYACKVDPDGNVGPTKVLATASFTFDSAIAFAQDRFLVCWEGGIQARLFDSNLDPVTPKFTLSNWADDADPSIATDGTSFFVAWTYLDAYWPEVRGTEVLTNGAVMDPGGVQLDAGSLDASSGPGLVWNGTSYVAAWSERAWDASQGSYELRVVFNAFDKSGNSAIGGPATVLASTEYDPWRVRLASLGFGDSYVGWTDTRNGTKRTFGGFGTVLDATGAFAPEQPFTLSPPAQLTPDLALGPAGATPDQDVNLAVFVSTDDVETRVVFQRVDGHGAAIDLEPAVIAGGKDTYEHTAVAWNGTLWLVVWEEYVGGFPSGRVLGARVLPDGSILDATPISILEANDPDVAAVGDDFLVVGSKDPADHARGIYGRRVRGVDGTLVDGADLWISGGGYSVAPSITAFDDRWLVAWQSHSTHDSPTSTIHAAEVLGSGVVTPWFYPTGPFSGTETRPDLVSDGGVATLAWADRFFVRARQVLPGRTPLGPDGGLIAIEGPETRANPTIGWDGEWFSLTAVDYRNQYFLEPDLGDLYGTRLRGDLSGAAGPGRALAADLRQPEGEAAIRGRNGISIVLYPAILPGYSNWRVSAGEWWVRKALYR